MSTASEAPVEAPAPETRPPKVRTRPSGARSLFDPAIMKRAEDVVLSALLLALFLPREPRTGLGD